ncbi:hypothetical protein ElyMa_000250800 [Elysia marginata]|uniref:Uncharacterized protein n=1 Tax=Elysia marginata TaxID=1093978 RepID=A0AAV4F4F2_9GAST|nr:hypothetical protein ElyMa_000250800 [Elysia marginata]
MPSQSNIVCNRDQQAPLPPAGLDSKVPQGNNKERQSWEFYRHDYLTQLMDHERVSSQLTTSESLPEAGTSGQEIAEAGTSGQEIAETGTSRDLKSRDRRDWHLT